MPRGCAHLLSPGPAHSRPSSQPLSSEWRGSGLQSVEGGSREEAGQWDRPPASSALTEEGALGPEEGSEGTGWGGLTGFLRLLLPCSPLPCWLPQRPACSLASPSCPSNFTQMFSSQLSYQGESRGLAKRAPVLPLLIFSEIFCKSSFWRAAIFSLSFHWGLAFSCRIEGPTLPGLPFLLRERLRPPAGAPHCGGKLFPWLLLSVQSTRESGECSPGHIRASLGDSES